MDQSKYEQYGASATKAGLHEVLKQAGASHDSGLFSPVTSDIAMDDQFRSFLHCDGAGTKSIVAYLMYQATKDPKVFAGLAQDALVMNLDDVVCIGKPEKLLLSNFISRNSYVIGDDILSVLIERYYELARELKIFGIDIEIAGGETADCGDVVRTLTVDAVLAGRIPFSSLIRADRIAAGDIVVGLSSTGKSSYEKELNSGISSNGLTLARHALLNHQSLMQNPDIVAPQMNLTTAYQGPYSISDIPENLEMTIGHALLSPTRTYAPILLQAYQELFNEIHAVIHCTGGGQSKVLRFGSKCRIIKDSLFTVPPLFELIQRHGKVSWKEMFQVFNMGHRMELYLPEKHAKTLISIAKGFNVDAQIIGHVEQAAQSNCNEVEIHYANNHYKYSL